MKWDSFSKEELQEMVNSSKSIAELSKKIGYSKVGGGAYSAVKKMIEYYQFDISHFLGQGHNKGNFDYTRFKNGNPIKTSSALQALISLRGRKCENCKNSFWLGKEIPLEIHHKDGNHLNNEMDNLLLLCPNCHSLTKNWRGRNINTGKKDISDEDFIIALKKSNSVRQALLYLGLSASGGNYERAYRIMNEHDIKF